MHVNDYVFLQKLTRLPVVDEIWLFGSRARNDHRERADIDLAIICPNATEQDWSYILAIIDEADTLLKIDCVRFEILDKNDKLRDNILRDHKIIYHKE